MDSAKPMGAQAMVKLNGTQKKTKSQECGEVTGLLKGDERGGVRVIRVRYIHVYNCQRTNLIKAFFKSRKF